MSKIKNLFLVFIVCLFSAKVHSTTCDSLVRMASNSQVFDEIVLASRWARDQFEGRDSGPAEERIRAYSNRLIPFGRTLVRTDGTSTREVSQIFRIVQSREQMIFLQAKKDSIQLLIGAPVSKETMAAAIRNSGYLIMHPPNPEPKFHGIFKMIVSASDLMKEVHGIDAFARDQDPFNREVAAVQDIVLVSFDLNHLLTSEQLADFLLVLWMSTEGS